MVKMLFTKKYFDCFKKSGLMVICDTLEPKPTGPSRPCFVP